LNLTRAGEANLGIKVTVSGGFDVVGLASGVSGHTASAASGVAVRSALKAGIANEAQSAAMLALAGRQTAAATVFSRAVSIWQVAPRTRLASRIAVQTARMLSLNGIVRGIVVSRATGVDGISLGGITHLVLHAEGAAALWVPAAGRSAAALHTIAGATRQLSLTGQATGFALPDRVATSSSAIGISGYAEGQTKLVGQASSQIEQKTKATSVTPVFAHGEGRVLFARRIDVAADINARASTTIAIDAATSVSGRIAALARSAVALSGASQGWAQSQADGANSNTVPVDGDSHGQSQHQISAAPYVDIRAALKGTTALLAAATKPLALDGLADVNTRTIAQTGRTPLPLTGTTRATSSLTATSNGKLTLTRQSRTAAVIEAGTVSGLHLQLQAAAIVPLHALGRVGLPLQGAARLPMQITAMGRGRFNLIGAAQSAALMHAPATGRFDLNLMAGAKAAAGGRALDRFNVARRGAGDIAVLGNAARIIPVMVKSTMRVSNRALTQPILVPNLLATGLSALQGKLTAQAKQPDGISRASITVGAALADDTWRLTALVLGVRAPPGQRRFTQPDTAQGGSVITVPRSGVLLTQPRAGRILNG
jgi:hypothetical protein